MIMSDQDPWRTTPHEGSLASSADASFTIDGDNLTDAVFVPGRPIRFRDTSGTWRYAIVSAVSGSTPLTVTIRGASMNTSYDDELQYAPMNHLVVRYYKVPGQFANAADTDLLTNDAFTPDKWDMGPAFCVAVSHIVESQDSGAAQPRVNFQIANSDVLGTDDAVAETSWQESTTDITIANYEAAYGDELEITTDANGTNDDADTLVMKVWFVLKRIT